MSELFAQVFFVSITQYKLIHNLQHNISCCSYSLIGRKDKEGIFQDPVTDLIAPGYSLIIKDPMDLSTMKTKIDSNEYRNVMEYRVYFLLYF